MTRMWWVVVFPFLVCAAACSSSEVDQTPVRPTGPLSPTPSTTVSAPTVSTSSASSEPTVSDGPPDEPNLDIAVRGGFLALRYTCTYVEGSFQAEWVEEARKAPKFGRPDPTERYTNDAAGGRADLIFGRAFNAGVGSRDPVRVSSRVDGAGRLTIWVTKPHPDLRLDLQAAGRRTLDDLAEMMSDARSGVEGGCDRGSAAPLPPVFVGTPDDT